MRKMTATITAAVFLFGATAVCAQTAPAAGDAKKSPPPPAVNAPASAVPPATGPTDSKKPMTAQQQKMGDCNKQAEGKTGDDRKAFMKQCLSATKMSQQDRMKKCNAEAGDKKGDARKAYMKQCLST